jgi:hypothetical protein
MITAMQMMLDDLISKREVYENAKMYQCVATLETSIELAKYLLKKEKEQFLDFLEWIEVADIKYPFNNWKIIEQYYKEPIKTQTP